MEIQLHKKHQKCFLVGCFLLKFSDDKTRSMATPALVTSSCSATRRHLCQSKIDFYFFKKIKYVSYESLTLSF